MNEPEVLHIYCDGGARGNPGPAAIGGVVKRPQGQVLFTFAKKIGEATNNVAEYTAVIEALTQVKQKQLHVSHIYFYLDSQVVAKQLGGLYKVKQNHLRELLFKVKILETQVGGEVVYKYIPREENSQADSLLNQALDA